MNDRDQFAAAALTGLIANGDYGMDFVPILAYELAEAMLRERAAGEKHRAWVAQNASLVAAAQAPTKPRTPQSDRLTEWERHGSHRWGLGVASDLYDLECRVAALEKTIHDAAPAARAVSDEDRTDKPATSHRRDRPGDTPVSQPTPGECSSHGECA